MAREDAGITMRELARRSGVSPAQVSRIEARKVEEPDMSTLVALARALFKDAQLLLIVAGLVDPNVARDYLEIDLDAPSGLFYRSDAIVEALRKRLKSHPTPANVREVAGRAFLAKTAAPPQVVDFDLITDVPDRHDLDEVLRIWLFLPEKRRMKLLDYARDQEALDRNDRSR